MSCYGLTNDGYLTKKPSIDLENSNDFNTIESQLWQKLINKTDGFWAEITNRYAQLRYEGWFTVEKLLEYIEDRYISKIGQRFYNQDARLKYTKSENQTYMYMCNGSRLEYTKRWLEERILYLDSVFEYTTAYQKVASIRTNVSDYLTLRMKAKSPRYIKIKWSDRLAYQKYFVSNDKYYEFTSPEIIDNTDNNLDMQGIETITEIESFSHLKPSALHLSGMESLTNVDAHGSPFLTEVTLESNKMLQSINLKDCKNLGLNSTGDATGNLNLIYCSNLKYLDISGTSLGSVNVIDIDTENPDASAAIGTGSLEFFDASDTSITDITLWNQSYLEEILIENCYQLATISIGNCEKLKLMSVPNSQVNKFVIVDCNALTYIDLSNTAKLVDLRLDGCPNLLTLKLKQVNSQSLTYLDLTTVPILQILDVSNTSFLKHITFAEGFTSLTSFDMRNSVLESVRFGKRVEFPDYLDLSPFNLTSVSFYNCAGLKNIKGLNYVGSGNALFYNCTSLISVEGSLTLNGNINQIFYRCANLTGLPTLDMTEVTSASEPFCGCVLLTLAQAKTIMNSLGDKITSSWRMFHGCTGIKGSIPNDFFGSTPNFSSLDEFFTYCSGITGFSSGLFSYLGNSLTNTRYMFAGTRIAGNVNSTWFTNNENLSVTESMFNGCTGLTGVLSSSLFANNINLTNASSMFNGCTGIQSRIPTGFFANNVKLSNVERMFNGCKGLYGTLPKKLFGNDNGDSFALTNCKNFVSGCADIYGAIPSDLFKSTPNLLYCDSMFSDTGIYGDIPSDLFSNTPILTTANSFLSGCTGLTCEIPEELFRNLTALSDVSYFFDGCTGITGTIPSAMFEGCTNLMYVAGLFRNCQKIYGNIPTDMFDDSPNLLSIASLFENCYNLTSDIPSNIFAKCLKVQDMSRVFANDYNLTGEIPAGLFDNCINVVDMSSMFVSCKGLGNRYVNELNPYALPEGLFDNCPNLQNVSDMFNMWNDIGGSSQMKGKLPERLFEACSKLTNANRCFANTPISGILSEYIFWRSTYLSDVSFMFTSTGIETLSDNVFVNNTNLINVQGLFSGCSGMSGNSTQFWNGNYPKITSYAECYRDCTSLEDYATIPSTWK